MGDVALLSGALAQPASAAEPSPLGLECRPENGVRFCPAETLLDRVPSFDGTPLDVDVTLPAEGDGPFPTVVLLPSWTRPKTDVHATAPDENASPLFIHTYLNDNFYAKRGYAVVAVSARGFGRSCGEVSSRTPDCARGWTHLGDQRFEARDAQWLLGRLVDGGIARADALGVAGLGFGGGVAVTLAYLRDRIRTQDGALAPWTSPRNSTFLALGLGAGQIAPAGADPTADMVGWFARLNRGAPYGADVRAILSELSTYSPRSRRFASTTASARRTPTPRWRSSSATTATDAPRTPCDSPKGAVARGAERADRGSPHRGRAQRDPARSSASPASSPSSTSLHRTVRTRPTARGDRSRDRRPGHPGRPWPQGHRALPPCRRRRRHETPVGHRIDPDSARTLAAWLTQALPS